MINFQLNQKKTLLSKASPWTDHDFVSQETQMMGRVRQERFMPEELVILVREVQARYHILYGRCVTQAKTRQAWEEIATAVDSTGLGHMRTATGCQKRNNDLKRRTRKKDKKRPQKQETKLPERTTTQAAQQVFLMFVYVYVYAYVYVCSFVQTLKLQKK